MFQNTIVNNSSKVNTNDISGNIYIEPFETEKTIDFILEKEKQKNKLDSWNKLDKTLKLQKLNTFADKYGKEQSLTVKEIKTLKFFLKESLDKNKLQKTKDVQYNKTTNTIVSIPSLFLNTLNRNFTLKNTDPKRTSTLKCLTPNREHIDTENPQIENL
jgi:hypothetical protein